MKNKKNKKNYQQKKEKWRIKKNINKEIKGEKLKNKLKYPMVLRTIFKLYMSFIKSALRTNHHDPEGNVTNLNNNNKQYIYIYIYQY